MYGTQNRNRTIGSHTVDQILNGSAVIICLLSRSRSDRGFLNRTHLTYVKANNIFNSKSTQKYQVSNVQLQNWI